MKRPTAEPKGEPAHAGHQRVTQISTTTTIAVLGALAVFLYAIQTVLLPFVLAGIVAYVCTPLVNLMKRRLHLPRGACAAIVFAVILGLSALAGYFAIPPMLQEAARIVTDLHGTLQGLAAKFLGDRSIELFGQLMNAGQIADAAVAGLREWVGQAGRVLLLATVSFAALFGFFLTWVLLLYFLVGGPTISRGLFWTMPPKQRPFAHRVWSELDPVLKRYFIGVAIIVIYTSVAAYIGLGLILGLTHAVFLALATGFLEMLPVIGPGAAAVIAGLAAVENASTVWSILAYVAYATLLRLSIDQMLGPLVLGRAGRIHPVLVIFCFLTGGLLFGVTGVIMAVPVAVAIKITLAALYEDSPSGAPSASKRGT